MLLVTTGPKGTTVLLQLFRKHQNLSARFTQKRFVRSIRRQEVDSFRSITRPAELGDNIDALSEEV